METFDDLTRRLRKALEEAGVQTPALDARLLARLGAGFSEAQAITDGRTPLSTEVIDKIEKMISRRAAGEPVSRIAGEREFWGLPFLISPDTLDPRPDTETLVAAAIRRAKGRPLRILDLGTGSGCLLIALLKEIPGATGFGIDVNKDAISVARQNAQRLGVGARAEFRAGSWFEPLDRGDSFDLIVSNPPYIPESHRATLQVEVRDHDPHLALFGGADGLDCYKIILHDLKNFLSCDGHALFEIGKGQADDLARLVYDSHMSVTESYRDLSGTLRVVEVRHGEKDRNFVCNT